MAQDLFHYEKMVEGALRGVVRDALKRAARDGLRSAHHFYIGFATGMPGVVIPGHLRTRYPEEMTIVLQHQYWDLEVAEASFSVTLSFQKQPERLVIPFAAVRSFADPSVDFTLQFAAPEGTAAKPGPAKTDPAKTDPAKTDPAKTDPAKTDPAKTDNVPMPADKPSADVVTLDSFRKR